MPPGSAHVATVLLDGHESIVRRVASTPARIVLGSGSGVEEEAYAVAEPVTALLRHPVEDERYRRQLAIYCGALTTLALGEVLQSHPVWRGDAAIVIRGPVPPFRLKAEATRQLQEAKESRRVAL